MNFHHLISCDQLAEAWDEAAREINVANGKGLKNLLDKRIAESPK